MLPWQQDECKRQDDAVVSWPYLALLSIAHYPEAIIEGMIPMIETSEVVLHKRKERETVSPPYRELQEGTTVHA